MTRRRSRAVVFFGELGTTNLGNEGSLDAVVADLRRRDPDMRMRVVGYGPEVVSARLGVPAERMNAVRPVDSPAFLVPLIKLLWRGADMLRAWRQVGRASCVIVPGAGVFEGELGTSPVGLPLAFWRTAWACRLRHVPLILVGVGVSPISEGWSRRLFTSGIRQATYASYRDEGSLACVRSWLGDPDHGELGADVAFALPLPATSPPPPPTTPPVAVAPVVAVGIMAGGGTRAGRRHEQYRKAVRHLIDVLVEAGCQVRLVLGDGGDSGMMTELDDGDGPSAVTAHRSTSLAELETVLQPCDLVVGTRFHNIVTALRLGKPTVAIVYAAKSAELMQAVGLEAFCLSADEVSAEPLVTLVSAALREARPPDQELVETLTTLVAQDLDRLWCVVGGHR